MSNKHLRRVLAEKEDQNLDIPKSESESEEIEKPKKSAVNKYALLSLSNEESDQEASELPNLDKGENLTDIQTKASKKRKNKKKKDKKQDQVEDDDAILEAAAKEALEHEAYTVEETTPELLLKVDPRNLLAENELKRLLGKNFGRPESKRLEKSHRTVTGKIVKIKPNWPPLKHTGLHMVLEKEEIVEGYGNLKWYRFKHNSDYQLMQQLFWMHLRELDHETILNSLLAENPYHLDSLLVLAEVTRVQEDVQVSRDALLSQNYLLDYTWRENRAFYLLLLRHLQHMIQRRTFFTAFQVAKVIFLNDPINDPLAMALVIDSLALKAKEFTWLIEFYNFYQEKKNFRWLPNFLYSVALAHYFLWKENGEKIHQDSAQAALKAALIQFPFVLGNLLDRMSIQPDSKVDNNYYLNALAINRETDGLKLLIDIYWKHTEEIWRQNDVLTWLETTTHTILPELEKSKKDVGEFAKNRQKRFVGMPQNVVRHAIVFDIRPSTESDSIVDPAPPANSKCDYEEVQLSETTIPISSTASNSTDSNTVLQFLRSILPDDAQESVDALFETYRERFPALVAQVFDQLRLGNNREDSSPLAEPLTTQHEQVEEHEPQQASTSQQGLSANNAATEGESSTGSEEKNKETENE